MKRRNFVKTSGFSLGAIGLASLVSTRGYADDTSGTCPATMTTDDSGTATYQRTRPWSSYQVTGSNPLQTGQYFSGPWSGWSLVSGGPAAPPATAPTGPTGGTPPCTYSSPNYGTATFDPDFSWLVDGDNNPETPPAPGAPPSYATPLESIPGGSTHVPAGGTGTAANYGTITETATKGWSRDIVWQAHGPCA